MNTVVDSEWRCNAMVHVHPLTDPPIEASHFFLDVSFKGGRVEFWVERGPRLRIRVCPPNAKPYTFASRQLIFTGNEVAEVAIACDEVKALLWINGQPAGSMGYRLPDDGPLEVRLPEWALNLSAEAQDWCSKRNEAAVEERKKNHSQTKAKPNRRLLDKKELFRSLDRELAQLEQLLRLVNLGSTDHIYGISGRIRSTICYMKNRNDLPLLQHCASFNDLPLLLYSAPPHWAEYAPKPEFGLGGRIYPTPIVRGLVELDLDVWLFLEAFRYDNTTYSANDVLRSFADSMGGAHHDKSVDPKIEQLFHHSRKTFGSPGIFNQMYAYVLEVAICVLSLGRQVASHRDV